MDQSINNGHERLASNLAAAVRSLCKYGFHVVQDPRSAALSEAEQQLQPREAACFLVAVPATGENLSSHAVAKLGLALLENGAVGLDRVGGPIQTGCLEKHTPGSPRIPLAGPAGSLANP